MKNDTDKAAHLKRKIKDLEKENENLNRIIVNTPIPIFVLNKNHKITHYNKALEDLSDCSADNMIGTDFQWKAFYGKKRPVMADLIIENASHAGIMEHYGHKYDKTLSRDGLCAAIDFFPDLKPEGKWLFFTAKALTDENGQITGAVEILQDVTEKKQLDIYNKTIMRISTALPQYTDLEDLMNYISMEIKNLLNAEGAVVLLYDEIKNDLFFSGASYDDSDTEQRARKIRFDLDSVFAGKIIKTGEPLLINNAAVPAGQYPDRDKKLGYETKSLLEVPIKSDGRIIGVLCAINKKQDFFDDKDMDLMTMLGGTVAISIENARFSDALKDAYRDVAFLNRARGRAINHLSHELKTPVAVLIGSLQILKKKLASISNPGLVTTLNRIERNVNRIMEIQDETADIMENKEYSARLLMLKMLETCQDELETLMEQHLDKKNPIEQVRRFIDREFGPRTVNSTNIDFKKFFHERYDRLKRKFHFRNVQINIQMDNDLPLLFFPVEILNKIMECLIKNAVENTPDKGRIDIMAANNGNGIIFTVHDFGTGIEKDHQKQIFEGFFSTGKTLLYSTKTPFTFNAGGKGADLLRMKLFSDRLGFSIKMESHRCCYLLNNKDDECPGDIDKCRFCSSKNDCLDSGGTVFSILFPNHKN